MIEKSYYTGNVREARYDDETLSITFSGGETYRYLNVPSAVALPLFEAESAGKYLNEHVKGKYEVKKV